MQTLIKICGTFLIFVISQATLNVLGDDITSVQTLLVAGLTAAAFFLLFYPKG